MSGDAASPSSVIAAVAAESGVPVGDLSTVAGVYGLIGEPYESTVILAPHVAYGSTSERAWYGYTWRMYREQRRRETCS